MGDIIDYVNEFQSVDFNEKPFEAVDGLVLACFAYLDFGKMVPSISTEAENVTIVDLSRSKDYEEMFLDICE